jgi:hypothetical protein
VRHGVFLINGGKESFFDTAWTGRRFRYDPGCMSPCDARARQTVQFFEDAATSAAQHNWTQSGQILLIDNRYSLHARASAVDEPEREIERISFHLNGESS